VYSVYRLKLVVGGKKQSITPGLENNQSAILPLYSVTFTSITCMGVTETIGLWHWT